MYIRKSALGIGLIKPSTAVQLQAIKLYIGNKRATSRINKVLNLHEELLFIEKGRNVELEDIQHNNNTSIRIWNEYIWKIL